MIFLINEKEKKGIIAPNKCASSTVEDMAYKSTKWKVTTLLHTYPHHQYSWKNKGIKWRAIIRSPLNWYISGYAYSLHGFLGPRRASFDAHLDHVIKVKDYIINETKIPHKEQNEFVYHCVIPPTEQIRMTGLKVDQFIKLEDPNFEQILMDWFDDDIPFLHENASPKNHLPELTKNCIKKLKLLDYGEPWGYNMKNEILKYQQKYKRINTV